MEAGLNKFTMTPQKWIENTNAKGIVSNLIEKYREKEEQLTYKLSIIENNKRYVYAKFKSKRI